MSRKKYYKYYFFTLAGVILASSYPLYMGIQVVSKMLRYGVVPLESYPKYVIPYTPIALALILGVLLIPVFQRLSEKISFLCGAVFSTAIFLWPKV